MKSKTKKIIKITLIVFVCLICVSTIFLYAKGWLHMPYKAQEVALEIINSEHNEYTFEKWIMVL